MKVDLHQRMGWLFGWFGLSLILVTAVGTVTGKAIGKLEAGAIMGISLAISVIVIILLDHKETQRLARVGAIDDGLRRAVCADEIAFLLGTYVTHKSWSAASSQLLNELTYTIVQTLGETRQGKPYDQRVEIVFNNMLGGWRHSQLVVEKYLLTPEVAQDLHVFEWAARELLHRTVDYDKLREIADHASQVVAALAAPHPDALKNT